MKKPKPKKVKLPLLDDEEKILFVQEFLEKFINDHPELGLTYKKTSEYFWPELHDPSINATLTLNIME